MQQLASSTISIMKTLLVSCLFILCIISISAEIQFNSNLTILEEDLNNLYYHHNNNKDGQFKEGIGKIRNTREVEAINKFKMNLDLQTLSLIQHVVNIWNEKYLKNKVVDDLIKYFNEFGEDLIETWSNHVVNNIEDATTHIPIKLIKDISYYIRPIGEEFIVFTQKSYKILKESGMKFYPTIYDVVDRSKWTGRGEIDKVGTFMAVFNGRKSVVGKPINNLYLFIEACKYCLEAPMEELWEELSDSERRVLLRQIQNEKSDSTVIDIFRHYDIDTRDLLLYWRLIFNKKQKSVLQSVSDKKITEINSFGGNPVITDELQNAITIRNIEATNYFLNQIKKEEHGPIIERTLDNLLMDQNLLKSKDNIDMLMFFLKRAADNKILEILRENKLVILDILMHGWPWRLLFKNILELSWEFITAEDYRYLFTNIMRKIANEYNSLERSSCTSIWMLIEILEKHSDYIEDGVIAALWALPLPKEMKLTAISIISPVIQIEKTIATKIRTEICKAFEKTAYLFLSQEKYEAISSFVTHFLNNDNERSSFFEKLGIEDFFKNILDNSDDHEDFKRIHDFLEWHKSTGDEAITTQLIEDIIDSDHDLKTKYRAFLNWKEGKSANGPIQSYTFLKG